VKHSECLQLLTTVLPEDVLTVTNLSSNARMWAALRGERPSFYGLNMGLCLPLALGLSLAFPRRQVVALDGDGSLIIQASSLITAADVSPPNLLAIVFDNGTYTHMADTATSRRTDVEKMAQGAGIQRTATVRTPDDFVSAVRDALETAAFTFLVAKVEADRGNPFPSSYPQRSERAMKEAFVDTLQRLPDYPRRQR
jgi:thiamine pyrophosphate-dependent acetolactate synthase large subunit-like protein